MAKNTNCSTKIPASKKECIPTIGSEKRAEEIILKRKQQTSELMNSILLEHLKRDPEMKDHKHVKLIQHPYGNEINIPGIIFQKDIIFKGILLGTITQYTDKATFKPFAK